jgi:uncharacterized protein (DUF433 family)/DNA-binding transcriptional MerR regulator
LLRHARIVNVPYPTYIAATLSGASLRQLQYWRSGGEHALFVPELPKAGGRVLYSFRDVVGLRTFVYLREAVSLQRIRKAVENLRELGNSEHLSQYQLVVAGKSIVLVEPGHDAAVDLVEWPGAQRFTVTLGDVFAPFENQRGDLVVDLFHPREHVVVDPEILGGYPVVEGTRVEFDLVASLVRDGVDPSEISEIYPSVSTEGAADAVDFATEVARYRDGELGAA